MLIDDRCQEITNKLAIRLSSWRSGNNLSKRKFADISLLAESTIRNIENAIPNIDLSSLIKVRLAYNTTLLNLFEESILFPKVIKEPIDIIKFEKAFQLEKINIGKRIKVLQDYRGLSPEELSLLSYNIDYSDTLKYQRGEKNIELRTIVKYKEGLEVNLTDIFNYKGSLPSNKFTGKMKK